MLDAIVPGLRFHVTFVPFIYQPHRLPVTLILRLRIRLVDCGDVIALRWTLLPRDSPVALLIAFTGYRTGYGWLVMAVVD